MRNYNLIREFSSDRDDNNAVPDVINTSPRALVVVWPFAFRQTFSRALGASFTTDLEQGLKTGGPVFIYDAVSNLSVSGDKSSYVGRMTLSLKATDDWGDLIHSGDHIAAWICNSESEIKEIISKINRSEPVNDWWSGFKFWGRVDEVGEDILTTGTGFRTNRYAVTATSHRELGSQIYWNPHLEPVIPTLTNFFARVGAALTYITAPDNRAGIDSQKALPFIFDVMTLDGIPDNLEYFPGNTQLQFVQGNKSFMIPSVVGNIFGSKPSSQDGVLRYGNIMHMITGVQKYTRKAEPNASPGTVFWPDAKSVNVRNTRYSTEHSLLGRIQAGTPDFFNKAVYSVLNDYLNPGCNEMYTAFRADARGNIFPTIVSRQLPFSTSLAAVEAALARNPSVISSNNRVMQELDINTMAIPDSEPEIRPDPVPTLTLFRELPRWVVHPMMVRGRIHITKTDARRVNYVQMTGQVTDGSPSSVFVAPQRQLIAAPPPIDVLDIARNGFRGDIRNIPSSQVDAATNGPLIWQTIAADQLMGSHLLYSGSVSLVGIQAPITHGDNVEIGNKLFHITGVNHLYSMSGNGQASFTTTLSLDHGVSKNSIEDDEQLGWAIDGGEFAPGNTLE